MREELIKEIFSINSENKFQEICLRVFKYQFKYNDVYRKYCDLIGVGIESVIDILDIPFLPISFFKTQEIVSASSYQKIFTSSGTTSNTTSSHYIFDLEIYEKSFFRCFSEFYGSVNDYVILALLPSYLERDGSSLVYMCEKMINTSCYSESSFYLNDYSKLLKTINSVIESERKVLLIGISYALLDFSENFKVKNSESLIVMETGGTKGMKKEMTKEELHRHLAKNFKVNKIHSEYGMTELLSQAYSYGDGIYETPSTMAVLCRDINNPFKLIENNKTGIINIIDLSNIDSCSFIATDDLGIKIDKKKFKIMGRLDNSDIRGCNLLSSDI